MPPPVPDRTETLVPRPGETPSSGAPAVKAEPPSGTDDPDRYEQVKEHARGGLGRVSRAFDRRLNRTVAVKELLRRGPDPSAHEARFLREAMITARLEHPGIVPVHEAGRWPSGDPYYVMKLVEGRTLKELIAKQDNLRERLGLLANVIAVADAVGYAHSEGVIHRDIKPSNVIVGEFGETVVVDWGLARDRKRESEPASSTGEPELAAGSGSTTVSGKVVGTPAYMSPEQARGEPVDERADVYAIGAVLYELLAGTPPHHDDTPQATLERVLAGPPRPVALTAPHVPDELATIVGKAMARHPEDRYPNATALAEDLRRFQTGKLVSAHTYTTWSLLRKRLAHHRGVVAMAIASAVVLAAVGVESFRRVVAERNIAEAERVGAVDARREAEGRQRQLTLVQARTALRKDPTATLAWLKTYEPGDDDRGEVQELIDEARALGVARHVLRLGTWVFDAAFTPDGKRVVAALRDGTVRTFDMVDGSETILGTARGSVEVMTMTPDGSAVVTGGPLGDVMVWSLDGRTRPRVISTTARTVMDLRVSPDGRRVLIGRETESPEIIPIDGGDAVQVGPNRPLRSAIAPRDWTRQVIATAPNQLAAVEAGGTRPLGQTSRMIWRLVMSPAGDLVLVYDGEAIWGVPFAGGAMTRLVSWHDKLQQIAWSPDETEIAIAGDNDDVVVVTLATGAVKQLRGHTDAVYAVQWTRDGRRLLSASDDGTARVWNIVDGTSQTLRGHDDDVVKARFSNDERQVVTASLDGSVRVWAIEQPGSRVLVEGHRIENMRLDGDRALVTTSSEVARWNLASGHREPVFSWTSDPRTLGSAIPTPDGERLLVPLVDWSIEVRRRHGAPILLRGHEKPIARLVISRDSKLAYTSSFDGTLRRWDLATGESDVLIRGDVPVRGFALAADGRIAAQVGDSAMLIAADGTQAVFDSASRCVDFAEFDEVRDRLIMRRCDDNLMMLDGDRWIELPSAGVAATRIAASADGRMLAGAMSDRTVRVWPAGGGAPDILLGHTDLVMDVAFSPDGTRLASASYDKTVRIWELASGRQRVLRGHALAVHRVAWRGSSHVVTASADGTLRIWDVPSMQLATSQELRDQLARATTAAIIDSRPSPTTRIRSRTLPAAVRRGT